jgi:hypothetical protein
MYTFMKLFCKTNLFMLFSYISILNDLKVIHDLYSQCLTQIMSKTTSFTKLEGVWRTSRTRSVFLGERSEGLVLTYCAVLFFEIKAGSLPCHIRRRCLILREQDKTIQCSVNYGKPNTTPHQHTLGKEPTRIYQSKSRHATLFQDNLT